MPHRDPVQPRRDTGNRILTGLCRLTEVRIVEHQPVGLHKAEADILVHIVQIQIAQFFLAGTAAIFYTGQLVAVFEKPLAEGVQHRRRRVPIHAVSVVLTSKGRDSLRFFRRHEGSQYRATENTQRNDEDGDTREHSGHFPN